MDGSDSTIVEQLRGQNAILRRYLLTLGELAPAGEVPLNDLLQKIVESARSLLGARYAALGIFDSQLRVKEFCTAGLTPEERAHLGPLPVGAGLLGLIVQEQRIIRIPLIAAHPASGGFPANHPPMTSFLGGPIARGEKVYGNLYLTDRLGAEEFSADDAELLAILADQAAIAIENAQRAARARCAEQQSQVERANLEANFDSLADAVFTTDPQGRLVRLNRPATAWAAQRRRGHWAPRRRRLSPDRRAWPPAGQLGSARSAHPRTRLSSPGWRVDPGRAGCLAYSRWQRPRRGNARSLARPPTPA